MIDSVPFLNQTGNPNKKIPIDKNDILIYHFCGIDFSEFLD